MIRIDATCFYHLFLDFVGFIYFFGAACPSRLEYLYGLGTWGSQWWPLPNTCTQTVFLCRGSPIPAIMGFFYLPSSQALLISSNWFWSHLLQTIERSIWRLVQGCLGSHNRLEGHQQRTSNCQCHPLLYVSIRLEYFPVGGISRKRRCSIRQGSNKNPEESLGLWGCPYFGSWHGYLW